MASEVCVREDQQRGSWIEAGDISPSRSAGLEISIVALSCFLVLLVLIGPDSIHPYVSGDDLPWEVSPSYYLLNRAQSEGRWFIYFFRAALGVWPRWVDVSTALLLWCATCATISQWMIGSRGLVSRAILCLALAASPPVFILLQWPHTAVPIFLSLFVSIVACYAFRQRLYLAIAAAFFASALNTLTYQTSTILVTGVILICHFLDRWRAGDARNRHLELLMLATACGAGAVFGVVASGLINLLEFGRYGIDVAEWRKDYSTDVEGLVEMVLRSATGTVHQLANQTLFLFPVLYLAGFGVIACRSYEILWTQGERPAADLWMFLAILAAVSFAHCIVPLLVGVIIPWDRAGSALWLSCLAAIVMASELSPSNAAANLCKLAVISLCVAGVGSSVLPFRSYSAVEVSNERFMAAFMSSYIRTVSGVRGAPKTTYLIGHPPLFGYNFGPKLPIDSWWIQNLVDFYFHKNSVFNKPVYCESLPSDDCPDLTGDQLGRDVARMPAYPNPGYLGVRDGRLIVKFSPG
jgi:hypothetical protein